MSSPAVLHCCDDLFTSLRVTPVRSSPVVTFSTGRQGGELCLSLLYKTVGCVAYWYQSSEQTRDGIYHFAAEADGELAGIITVRNPQHPRLRHTTNLGMFVDENHAGKGVGSALIAFALRYSFQWLGAVIIELEVFTDNRTAIGLYKKFGFREEGIRTKSALKNGQYVDVLMMGLEVQEAGGLPVSSHE